MERLTICIDTSILIRLIEGPSEVSSRIRDVLSGQVLIASSLAITECLTKPLRFNEQPVIAAYDELFSSDRLAVVDATGSIARSAAALRARHRLKTPDAVHLATAIELGANEFLTADRDFERDLNVRPIVRILTP